MPFPSIQRAILLAIFVLCPLALPSAWYSDCMACEKHLGGNSKIGPFETLSDCDHYVELNKKNNYPYRDCYSDGAGQASGSAGKTGLEDSTAQALAHGLTHGNAEALGLGMLGLGTMALLQSGSSAPSAAQQEAAREAQREQWRHHQAAEIERRKRFEEGKQELVSEFKGSKAEKEAFGLGDDGDLELKDVPASPKKKKFKPPKLKPFDNPLRKTAGPEDFTGGTVLPDWERAKVFTRASGGTMARESSGVIRWCPDGFPYSCGQDCYTARAHQDHKIPCSSTLLTLKPED